MENVIGLFEIIVHKPSEEHGGRKGEASLKIDQFSNILEGKDIVEVASIMLVKLRLVKITEALDSHTADQGGPRDRIAIQARLPCIRVP